MTDDEIRALVDDPALRSAVPAVELAEAFLERLEGAQTVHAMITITPELALAQARDVDERRSRGQRLALDGMPIVIKDNIDVAGVPTTVGSRLFADRTPTDDAEVTLRLREAGAVILGKANMHELAFGATSANDAFGAVVNPAAPDRIPGGSSGGSGAAVAADLCLAAIGTDTGGSVRLPASLCGVSGIRPTYGAVSNRGVQPVCASLDTVGALARAVTDVRSLLAVLAGSAPVELDVQPSIPCSTALDDAERSARRGRRGSGRRRRPGGRVLRQGVRRGARRARRVALDALTSRAGRTRSTPAGHLIQWRGAGRLRRGVDEPARAARGRARGGASRSPQISRRPTSRACGTLARAGPRTSSESFAQARPDADADDPGRGAPRGRCGHAWRRPRRRPLHLRLRLRARPGAVAPVRDERRRGTRRRAARGGAAGRDGVALRAGAAVQAATDWHRRRALRQPA